MVVQRHQADPRLTHAQDPGAAHQRDVVEVQDVERLVEKGIERGPVQRRKARLLTDERREQSRSVAHAADLHAVLPGREGLFARNFFPRPP